MGSLLDYRGAMTAMSAMTERQPVREMLNFTGRTVLVTGASQGIGAGIARRFAEAGANVLAHYRSNEEAMASVISEIEGWGGIVASASAELTDRERVTTLIAETRERFGSLDVLVNNAGMFPNAELIDMTEDQWRAMFAANVDTAMFCTQAATRDMKAHGGGAILNIASISGMNPAAAHAHYNSTKAALIMFSQSAAQELGPYGIRVNTVSPGLIAAPGIEETWPDGVERWQKAAPLGSMGEPEDVADACLFLASSGARFITGPNLVVDGGVLSSMNY